MRLDHVQVAAPPGCEAAARAFFVGRLGFVELPKPVGLTGNGGAWFQAGAVQVHVGVEPDFRPARKAHVGFDVGSVQALVALYGRLDGGRWDTGNREFLHRAQSLSFVMSGTGPSECRAFACGSGACGG